MRKVGEYILKYFKIFPNNESDGQDYANLVTNIVMYENIFTSNITIRVSLLETLDLISSIPIIGQEKVKLGIEFPDGGGVETPSIDKDFIIYNITGKTRDVNRNTYTLDLVTEDFMNSFNNRIGFGYKEQSVSSIISSIASENLKTPSNISASDDNQKSIVIPNMSTFRAINWLRTKAYSNQYGSPFFFYETLFDYKFKTMKEMAKEPAKVFYVDSPKVSADASIEDLKIIEWTTTSEFNILDNIINGMYQTTAQLVDCIGRTSKVLEYDYWDSGYSPVLGKNILQSTSRETHSSTNEYILQDDFTKTNNYDKYFLEGLATNQIFDNYKLKLKVFGNSMISSGDIINLEIQSQDLPDTKDAADNHKKYSGNWLVFAISHEFNTENYIMEMEVVKDGSEESYV